MVLVENPYVLIEQCQDPEETGPRSPFSKEIRENGITMLGRSDQPRAMSGTSYIIACLSSLAAHPTPSDHSTSIRYPSRALCGPVGGASDQANLPPPSSFSCWRLFPFLSPTFSSSCRRSQAGPKAGLLIEIHQCPSATPWRCAQAMIGRWRRPKGLDDGRRSECVPCRPF